MSLRSKLSKTLVECKEYSGLTYNALSEITGCSRSTIRYALNGGKGVSIESFEKLFLACGVSLLNIEVEFEDDNYE